LVMLQMCHLLRNSKIIKLLKLLQCWSLVYPKRTVFS